MPNMELLLLLVALSVAGFAAWRILASRNSVRQDQSHVATLIGTVGGGQTVNVREQAPDAPGRFEKRFRTAGIDLPVPFVFTAVLLVGAAVALGIAAVFPGVWWAYPLFGLAAAWIVLAVINDVARYKAWRFESRLADAIDLMVGALSAGETTVDAMASAATGAQQPVAGELSAAVERLRSSVPIARALRPMADKYDSEGVRLFTLLLIAKWEVGGPLAPALQAVNRTLRQGLRLRGQLQTQISSAQSAALLVALLPYAAVAIFLWKSPEALVRIWSMPWGPSLFIGAILLQITGFIWLRSILRTEV